MTTTKVILAGLAFLLAEARDLKQASTVKHLIQMRITKCKTCSEEKSCLLPFGVRISRISRGCLVLAEKKVHSLYWVRSCAATTPASIQFQNHSDRNLTLSHEPKFSYILLCIFVAVAIVPKRQPDTEKQLFLSYLAVM